MDMIRISDIVSHKRAAEELGVSVVRIKQFCAQGRLGTKAPDGRYIITNDDVERFKNQPRVPGRPRA